MKISAIILTKNNENTIERALSSITSFAEEILVIDSGSTDNTIEIASKMGAKVLKHVWEGYVKQRIFSISQTRNKWVFILDSDEQVSEELASWIQKLEKTSFDFKGVWIKRIMMIDDKPTNLIWRNEYRLRLFNKDFAQVAGMDPHDKIIVKGKTIKVSLPIFHYSYRDISDQVDKLLKHAKYGAKALSNKKTSIILVKLTFSPIFRFIKLYILNLGFLLGIKGLILCINEAYYVFLKYALALEDQKSKLA